MFVSLGTAGSSREEEMGEMRVGDVPDRCT